MLALLFDEDAKSLSIVAPLFGNNAPAVVEHVARENFPGWTVTLDLDLPPVATRLQSRGIDLPPNPDPDPAREPDTRPDAEIDALIDEALAYHPEEEIARLEVAAEAMVEGLVAAATAKGQTVKIIRQGGRARVVKPAKAPVKAKPRSKAGKAK